MHALAHTHTGTNTLHKNEKENEERPNEYDEHRAEREREKEGITCRFRVGDSVNQSDLQVTVDDIMGVQIGHASGDVECDLRLVRWGEGSALVVDQGAEVVLN